MANNKNYWAGRSSAGPSRRTFLKASALAAGAVTFSGPLILRAAPKGAAQGGNALNVALVGNGIRGAQDKGGIGGGGGRLIAVCDVDASKAKGGGNVTGYTDYRKMLESEKTLDAVIIATPDHWHAPLSKAFMLAGKHVYCEKPMTRTVAEAIEIKALAKTCKVATQLGNQGASYPGMRRSVEVIQAGALGQIHEVYGFCSGGGFPHDQPIPQNADPIPAELDWDFWCGPSPVHPYKKNTYHPYKWRGWFDYGTGQMGNFGTHSLNLPVHALRLDFPDKIELLTPPSNHECYPKGSGVRFYFSARPGMDACTMTWYDGAYTKPDIAAIKETQASLGDKLENGVLIIGEKGIIHTDSWNGDAKIKLKDDAKFTDILKHAGTASIPQTEPKTPGHMQEWILAAKTGSATYSSFDDHGGTLGAIIAAGDLTLRTGKSLEFDAATKAVKDPDAQQYYGPAWRKKYTVGGPGGAAAPTTAPAAAAKA